MVQVPKSVSTNEMHVCIIIDAYIDTYLGTMSYRYIIHQAGMQLT